MLLLKYETVHDSWTSWIDRGPLKLISTKFYDVVHAFFCYAICHRCCSLCRRGIYFKFFLALHTFWEADVRSIEEEQELFLLLKMFCLLGHPSLITVTQAIYCTVLCQERMFFSTGATVFWTSPLPTASREGLQWSLAWPDPLIHAEGLTGDKMW